MENSVRLPLGFVTRIRDRRFVAIMQKEKTHEIEEKRMIRRIAALAAIAVWMGSSIVPAGDKQGPSDKAALALDRMVIEDTLRRYVRALDDSDLDAYLATLTDDAKFVSAEGSYAGKDAIRKYVEPVMRSRKQRREAEGAQATATHHVVTNQSIEFTDRNSAVVRAYWMFVVAHGANKPMTIDLMGSSEDYLIRKDGKWLIRERRVAP
jgi:3-phenylpropionate/cinnamic acid dioxygenase small subunit